MSVLINRSPSAFLRFSHANKYPNGLLLPKQHTDIYARPNTSHHAQSKDAGMKVDNKLPNVLFHFEPNDDSIPSENVDCKDSLSSLMLSDSNLRPSSRRGQSSKSERNKSVESVEEEETDNCSQNGALNTEKSSNKQGN